MEKHRAVVRRLLSRHARQGAIRPSSLALIAQVLLASACTLGNLDELENGQCAEGQKACQVEGVSKCVSKEVPAYGCGIETCAPCAFVHGEARCGLSGRCELSACRVPFQDCNNNLDDGCEANTDSDPSHCGSSCRPCTPANAIPLCTSGVCSYAACLPNFGDCNHDASDGCEVDLRTSDAHCGSCDSPCGAGATCETGTCR